MKHLKSFVLTALAATAFAACSNDDIVDGNGPGSLVPTGEETYVTFNFKVNGSQPGTRAAMIPGKTEESENKVADGRVLIFDAASGALITNEKFSAATATTFKTTSGERRIYVLTGTEKTEIGKGLDGLTKDKNLKDFYALMSDGKLDGGADEMGPGFAELFADNAFVMSNMADRSAVKTIVPGISASESATDGADPKKENPAVNRFEFKVQRAIAKGNLKVELTSATMTTTDGIFTLDSEVEYGVRNVNRSTHYVQQFINNQQTNDDVDATHSATALRPYAAFYNVFDAPGLDLASLDTYEPYYYGGYAIKGANAVKTTMVVNGGGAATPGNAVYFSENSNNQQLRGNTSYYGITTKVASIAKANIASAISYDPGTTQITTVEAADDYTTGNFWAIREIPADVQGMLKEPVRKVFTDAAVAFEAMSIIVKSSAHVTLTTTGFTDNTFTATELEGSYKEALGGTATTKGALNDADMATINKYLGEYKDGVSYYRLNIYETVDDTRRHLIRRNHFYNAKVTSFATIGAPNEEDLDKDPEKPVDADVTNVTAIITVAPWHNMEMSDDL